MFDYDTWEYAHSHVVLTDEAWDSLSSTIHEFSRVIDPNVSWTQVSFPAIARC
jgi:hypothetical protein